MKHLLCECGHYSEPLWYHLSDIITRHLNSDAADIRVLPVEVGQHNVIFNVPHQSWLHQIHDKTTRSVFILLTREIKRDIVIRRINLPPPSAQQVNSATMVNSPQDSTLQRLWSYLQYIGLVKYNKAADDLCSLNLNPTGLSQIWLTLLQ
jgi:hypothetical protein